MTYHPKSQHHFRKIESSSPAQPLYIVVPKFNNILNCHNYPLIKEILNINI